MPKRIYGVFFSLCLISGLAGASSAEATRMAPASAIPTVTLSPITALFVQAEYATHFNVHATDTKGRTLKYNWSLKLQLVDPAKAVNPGTPGSGATVDLNCNNQGKLSSTTLEFIWKHGDASLGGCDHSKMGPSGHQGRITVVVNDGAWACTAIYNGTNTGVGKGATCALLVTTTATASAKPKTSTKPYAIPKTATVAKCKGTKLSLTATPPNGKPPLSVTFAMCSPKSVQWRIDYGDGKSKVAIGSPPTSITHVYTGDGDYVARLTTIASQSATTSSSVTAGVSVHLAQLISLTANPASGASPLRLTFGLGTSVVKITTWALDFGDGVHTGGAGKPPASVTHSYTKDGNFKATFSVKPGAYALVYTVAQITVGAGTPPILGVSVAPSSGTHPLAVKFTIGTTIPGVIVSWVMKFGDGYQQNGQGKPPTSVSHTYTKKGVYLAYLVVSQQQQYGGVQYIVPRNGLPIQVK